MSSKGGGQHRRRDLQQSSPQYCHLCGQVQGLKRCAACRSAWYCCKEHQITHWPAHKHVCRNANGALPPSGHQQQKLPSSHSPLTPPAEAPRIGEVGQAESAPVVDSQLVGDAELQSLVDDLCSNQQEWIASLSFSQQQQLLLQQNQQMAQSPQLTAPMAAPIAPPESDWVDRMKQQVVNDMNLFGVCVVDNFLGAERANEIYSEVIQIYQHKNLFQRGQVVNAAGSGGVLVRGDHIAWLDGSEPNCSSIRFLIRSLDSIVARCGNQGSASGEMGMYRITQRTKAMLACYPGGGTRYYKHVDNPNFDGRKVTCIYYLNKGWDGRRDGGLLRIYPENHKNHVASVEPILDRLVMFWSDRRNPHEVLPSERIRFALTVWYLDDNELAMQKCLNDAGSTAASHSSRCQLITPFTYGGGGGGGGVVPEEQLQGRQPHQPLSQLQQLPQRQPSQ